MALTRKFLAALGIEEAQADEIIEAHTATLSSIKAELEQYKSEAERLSNADSKLEKVQKELDDFKEANSDNEYKTKYDELKKEFDDYKQSVKNKEIKDSKSKAFKELLREANISEKRFDAIVKLSDEDIDKLVIEEDGSVKDKDTVLKAITDNWSEYIQTKETVGANTATPPANTGGVDSKISRARQIAQQYHDDLYGKIKED